jgi:uncharacterized protein YlxP (DUF503 family)
MDDVRVYTGTLIADLVLHGAQSLKDRRAVQRALIQRLKNQDFSVAQVGPADLVQRVWLAVAVVSGKESLVEELLDGAERMMFSSEFEVGDLRRDIGVETFYSG